MGDISDYGTQKVMAIVGTRKTSDAVKQAAIEQFEKAVRSGWRVATGAGNRGVDRAIIEHAIATGQADKLDVYYPKSWGDQYKQKSDPYTGDLTARSDIQKRLAESNANKIEYAGTKGIRDKSIGYGEACTLRNKAMIENADAVSVMYSQGSKLNADLVEHSLSNNKTTKLTIFDRQGALVDSKVITDPKVFEPKPYVPPPTPTASPVVSDKTMAIIGSREMSAAMQKKAIEQANKALDSGWRVSTGGAYKGVDKAVIEHAVKNGTAGKLDIYLPESIEKQGTLMEKLLNEAKAQGANIKEYAAGENGNYAKNCLERNKVIVENSDAVCALQNDGSSGTQSTIKEASKAGKPCQVFTYSKGILTKAAKIMLQSGLLKTFVPIASIVGFYALLEEYKDLHPEKAGLDNIQDPNFWNFMTEKLTGIPVDGKLEPAGDEDDSGHTSWNKRGNPYHDGFGKFCSESEAITVSA